MGAIPAKPHSMNGQETQKTKSGEAPKKETAAEKTSARPESQGGIAGTLGQNASSNGEQKKKRRRKANAEQEALAVEKSKGDARRKLETQIKALETLKSLV